MLEVNPTNGPVYATTTFTYGNPTFPHYITDIKDPRELSAMRSEYDSDGRLIATIDVFGHQTILSHNAAARSERLRPRREPYPHRL